MRLFLYQNGAQRFVHVSDVVRVSISDLRHRAYKINLIWRGETQGLS